MVDVDAIVIGAGQAGLSTSRELTWQGVKHVVLERGRIGETWRGRWDSFCLVTPNWTVQLPGFRYDGPDPDGYMPRGEIVDYLERYARSFEAPVREGVQVRSLVAANGGFELETSTGTIRAGNVVVTTGAYQRPHRPPGAATLPGDLPVIDVEQYRNSDALPPGGVLVVGSGQSGCQIAEELHQAGRDVVLACGRAPWTPRRIGNRDFVWWMAETGFLDVPVGKLASPSARLWANGLATGHGGGHDLHLRTLHAMGVTLVGHFVGVEHGSARFARDLRESVAWGDLRYNDLLGFVKRLVSERGLAMPPVDIPAAFDYEGVEAIPLPRFGSVIFAGGFRPDYRRWIEIPEAFDDLGFPVHQEGASLAAPGLYFAGVHFLRKRKSTLFYGVGEDAAIVARLVADRVGARRH